MMGGAERGWGTILRGAGRAGVAAEARRRPELWLRAPDGAGAAGTALTVCAAATVARGTRPMARLFFVFLLLGQNGLQHITGLGDVREIDFWLNVLRRARRRQRSRGRQTCRSSALKMRANLLGLVLLQRTGVRLAAAQAEFRQYVKNLPALDFHLACEIVDSNLTHPPLFELCYPKPLVAHSYLMALAALKLLLLHPIGLEVSGASTRRSCFGCLHLLIFAFGFVCVGNVFDSQFRGGDSFRFRVRLSIQIGAGEISLSSAAWVLSASSRTSAAFSASASDSSTTAGASRSPLRRASQRPSAR